MNEVPPDPYAIVFALNAIAPWLLIPAAVGSAIAGILKRRRTAIVLLGIAALAVVAPIALSILVSLGTGGFD